MLLPRLIGHSDASSGVTAALAGIASNVRTVERTMYSMSFVGRLHVGWHAGGCRGLSVTRRGSSEPPRSQGGCNDAGVLMFPDVYWLPPQLAEGHVFSTITGDRRVELQRPPLSIRTRPRAMYWTGVPEAAVDEDR